MRPHAPWSLIRYLIATGLVLVLVLRGLLSGPATMSVTESMKQAAQCWATARQMLSNALVYTTDLVARLLPNGRG